MAALMEAEAVPGPRPEISAPVGVRGAVELRGLTKRYGDETVVNSIAVSIAPGEFFSLLGPSGSGKTTTLMMVAGFVHPSAGDIRIGRQSVIGPPAYMRNIGVVF